MERNHVVLYYKDMLLVGYIIDEIWRRKCREEYIFIFLHTNLYERGCCELKKG